MLRDGEKLPVYLGEDRQLYFNKLGKTLCQFAARILHHGSTKYIFITDIPDKFDKGRVIPPPGYKLSGLE